jgi:predicted nicotinamide N-methyase
MAGAELSCLNGDYPRAMTYVEFVRSATLPRPVPLVPEITVRTASDPYELWETTGHEPPPFWAFPWAGGQGLARYLLDQPRVVKEKRVTDIASGSGLVAIAAALAGASEVTATDIDPRALAAITLNAEANGVAVRARPLDLTSAPPPAADVVLAGDIFYERAVAPRALEFARAARAAGADVLIADPGRAFVPAGELRAIGQYDVPVIKALEDTDERRVTIYRLARLRASIRKRREQATNGPSAWIRSCRSRRRARYFSTVKSGTNQITLRRK